MEHWLDKKMEELKKKDVTAIGDEEKVLKNKRVIANFERNKQEIEFFIGKLKDLFNKLNMVKDEGFEYYHEYKSIDDEPALLLYVFSGENRTQHPAFLRRLEIAVSEEENKMQIKMFRGKPHANEKPWKYHDEQEFLTDIPRLDEERAYELIDWFAWKIYTPRGLR